MYRLVLTATIGIVALLPQPASAEYAWLRQTREFASCAADRIGQYWNTSVDACAATTRRWVRNSVDYFDPAARQAAAQRCGLRLPEQLGDTQRALHLCEAFMRRVIANLDNDWVLTSGEIEEAVAAIEVRR